MQKFALFLLLTCFFLLHTGNQLQAQVAPESIVMGYELGAHFDSIPKANLLKMGKFQKLIRFDRQDEGLKIGGVNLVFVRLFFWDNHLHSVEIKTAEGQGPEMLAYLKSTYGEGKKADAMGYRYQWFLPTMRVISDENMAVHQSTIEFVDELTNNKYYKYMYNRENGN